MAFTPYPKDKDKPKEPNTMSVSEYRVSYLKGTGKKNKYNAKKQTYNGNKYDSTLEAKVAEDLDWQLKSGDLIEVKRQVKIPLMVNKILICNYYMDFKVIDKHGQVKYIEVKGMELPLWQMKKKLFIALLPEIDNGAIYEIIK
jgi:hypothetical protein